MIIYVLQFSFVLRACKFSGSVLQSKIQFVNVSKIGSENKKYNYILQNKKGTGGVFIQIGNTNDQFTRENKKLLYIFRYNIYILNQRPKGEILVLRRIIRQASTKRSHPIRSRAQNRRQVMELLFNIGGQQPH